MEEEGTKQWFVNRIACMLKVHSAATKMTSEFAVAVSKENSQKTDRTELLDAITNITERSEARYQKDLLELREKWSHYFPSCPEEFSAVLERARDKV